MRYLFLSLRPRQWIKNFFIFLPLVFGRKIFSFPENLNSVIAFLLFSLAASAVYLINDIIDAKKDKLHPIKRLRPIASGRFSIGQAKITAIILSILSIAFSFTLNKYFGFTILAYIIFNFMYTFFLKNLVIIDVFCIGGFFLLRIIAGSIVANVQLSHWILIITILLALFLGFNKRRQELRLMGKSAAKHRNSLINYTVHYIDLMIAVITSSIVMAYMLYAVDARTIKEFNTSNLIYTIPFVYYGLFRYLYIIYRFRRDGDPTRILLTDKVLQLDIILWINVCIAVIYFKA